MAKRPPKLDVSYLDSGDPVSPVGVRYTTPIARIFGESSYIQAILDVEAQNVSVISEMYPSKIPRSAARKIRSIADTRHVAPRDIRHTEALATHHEMGAVIAEMSRRAGKDGKYIHFAMTSADAVETARAMQLSAALEALAATVAGTRDTLLKVAVRWKGIAAIMRTHGQQAIPSSFGMPFAFFGYCLHRNLERLRFDMERCAEGKLSGAIGTYDVHTSEGIDGREVERRVLGRLKVRPAEATMQTPPREGIAYIVSDLAVLCGRLESIAEYIKTLKRTEILEMKEEPDEGMVGSSAMPHKNLYGNPFIEERCVSIARTVRGHALSALESLQQEDFRDLTASLSDRISIPESFILSDYSCRLIRNVVERSAPVPENIGRNLRSGNGAVASQLLMSRLVKKGVSREEARRLALRSARAAQGTAAGYIGALLADPDVSALLGRREIEQLADPQSSMGRSKEIVERIARKYMGRP